MSYQSCETAIAFSITVGTDGTIDIVGGEGAVVCPVQFPIDLQEAQTLVDVQNISIANVIGSDYCIVTLPQGPVKINKPH